MTEPTTITETETETEVEEEATEPAATVEEDPTEEATVDSPNREAAKWRARLREAETERDQLAAILDANRVQIVERLLPANLDTAVFWKLADHDALAATVGDDGYLDLAALEAHIDTVARSINVPRRPAVDPTQGTRGTSTGAPTWSDALAGRY